MSEYEAVIKAIDTIMSFYYTHEAGGTTCTWVSDIDGVVLHTDWGYFEQGLEEIKGYCEMLEVKAKKLADRKTEPQYSEDDMYWLSLAEDVANGKMSDAGANQAWLEYINHKDENSSEKPNNCEACRFELYCPEMCEGCCEWDSHYEPKDKPQTDCAWK